MKVGNYKTRKALKRDARRNSRGAYPRGISSGIRKQVLEYGNSWNFAQTYALITAIIRAPFGRGNR